MHYYLALTSKCNLLCKYCYGKSVEDNLTEEEMENYDFTLSDNPTFTIEELKKYASQDKDFVLTFYGGEPLLKIDILKEMMDKIPAKEFMLQTNGIFLNKLDSKYLNKISTILVSIDGTLEHTNERRGKLVYEKIINNVKLIRKNGFTGEIIARMTVDETSNIYENVTYLQTIKEFNSIHWQIDAGFWKNDYAVRDFRNWTINSYNPGIKKLIDWWIKEIETTKQIPRIYPFLGVIDSIRNKVPSMMKCGAGHEVLGIQTNGIIAACPITAGCKSLYMGDIKTSSLKEIKENPILPDDYCLNCDIKDICGGRCLYANKTQLWEEHYDEVCDTIRFLVNSLTQANKEINKLIENKTINEKQLKYPKYNGVEIIP